MDNINNYVIDENTSIKDLTDGKYNELKFNSAGTNYQGPLVQDIVDMIDRAGGDVTNTRVNAIGSTFKNIVLNYQKKFGLKETGIVDDNLLHDIYNRAKANSNPTITSSQKSVGINSNINNVQQAGTYNSEDIYDAHYDPFFLNTSDKIGRRNHKDIVISFGDGANTKLIKDVFMRSMSVQVDTSGNPIAEVYSFIARDIKESDATEDATKYVGEEDVLSASSDIKYNYSSLFKDI